MDRASLLRSRAADLHLQDADIAELDGRVDDELVQAVLANLVKFEEALDELAR